MEEKYSNCNNTNIFRKGHGRNAIGPYDLDDTAWEREKVFRGWPWQCLGFQKPIKTARCWFGRVKGTPRKRKER